MMRLLESAAAPMIVIAVASCLALAEARADFDDAVRLSERGDHAAARAGFRTVAARAATGGDARAREVVALIRDLDEGVPVDDGAAVRWYRLAAEQGRVAAQSAIGLSHLLGIGVPRDDREAVRWLRLAAEQGDATSQFNLGRMYANGLGVPRDLKAAYFWYLLASAQGNEGLAATHDRDRMASRLSPRERAAAQAAARDWTPAHTRRDASPAAPAKAG